MTYCTKCGAEESPEETGYFDKETGKPKIRMVCSKTPCDHSGCDVDIHHQWATSFWSGWTLRRGICKRCGKKHWYEIYC